MKYCLTIAACLFLAFAFGCKKNPHCVIQLPVGPEYVGSYLKQSDVRRIGHALGSIAARTPVKWENGSTGYQFSMMIFTSDKALGTTTRNFSVLAIQPSGDAEVLNLVGSSDKKNVWRIVAEGPASQVGKAARMNIAATPVPKASLSSGADFNGFMVAN